jgi:pimeloyl-ACP methyl ester carboxylesterase
MISTADATLHVRSMGSGPPLVLLPGLGRPAEDLDPLAARLAVAGYRVIQPDSRGGGGSSGPLEGLTLHDLARDVAAVIEAFEVTDATIIGHAFGNRIARTVAADRPDLASRVVLLGCSGKVQPEPAIAEAIRLAQLADTPATIRAEAVRAAWFAPGRDVTVWMSGWSQPVMKAYLAAAAATEITDWWTAGAARVLILQCLADVSAPPENGRLLKAEIGDRATLVELPDIGHSLPVEAPGAVAEAILAYLAAVKDERNA